MSDSEYTQGRDETVEPTYGMGHVDGARSVAPVLRRLVEAIEDIDAHAAPLGEDDDGFIAGGYIISVGCLHRALGVVTGWARPVLADIEEPRDV